MPTKELQRTPAPENDDHLENQHREKRSALFEPILGFY